MDTLENTSPTEDPGADHEDVMESSPDTDTSGTADSQNISQNVRLPSYYASTPLVKAPVPQPAEDTTQSGDSTTEQVDEDNVTLEIGLNQGQVAMSNNPSPSAPVSPDQVNPSLPYPPQGNQQTDPAYPPTALPYPSTTSTLPYPPIGLTETPELFPEQYPQPVSPYPAHNGADQTSVTGSPNGTELITNEDITQGDGQVVNHGRHGLMKLPSYAGGGQYPAEPPPSYEDSNPIPVPQSMTPREPSSAAPPPTAQLISRNFGTTPIYTICPSCGEEITTVTVFVPGALTYLMVCIFLMLGWWFLCCFVPFCVQGFKDVHHVCPNCKKTIGRYDRIGN